MFWGYIFCWMLKSNLNLNFATPFRMNTMINVKIKRLWVYISACTVRKDLGRYKSWNENMQRSTCMKMEIKYFDLKIMMPFTKKCSWNRIHNRQWYTDTATWIIHVWKFNVPCKQVNLWIYKIPSIMINQQNQKQSLTLMFNIFFWKHMYYLFLFWTAFQRINCTSL